MFQDYFRDGAWLGLPLIGLCFFFLFFLLVLARVVFTMRDPRRNEELAAMPLREEVRHDG